MDEKNLRMMDMQAGAAMYIIVGLGNPGKDYAGTRHNVGFQIIDKIADDYDINVIESKHKAFIGKGYVDGHKVILVKPQTFMNLSGESVRAVIDYYKIEEQKELIVIYDDVSMDVGQIRIRKKGSAGGHNGIKNIIAHLGHDVFLRIKVGVGEKPKGHDLADYVLGHFDKAEQEIMDDSGYRAAEAVRLLISGKVDEAMNQYNKKAQ